LSRNTLDKLFVLGAGMLVAGVVAAAGTGLTTQQARTAAPSALTGTTISEGSALSFARSDHQHSSAITATGSTTARTMQARAADVCNVKDYGALGDGATDDTAAFAAALAACTTVFVPTGTFVVSSIAFGGSTDPNTSATLLGKRLIGSGMSTTTIQAKTGTAATNLIYIGNSNYGSDGKYYIRNQLSDMSINAEAMTNNTATAAVYLYGTYDNIIQNLKISVIDAPRNRWDLSMGRGTYTTTVINVHGKQLQLSSDTLDRVTTTNFVGCSWTFVNLNNALGIHFVNTSIQGVVGVGYQANRVQISASYNIYFNGGDLEGTGTGFSITGSTGVEILNNNVAMTASSTAFINAASSSKIYARDNIFMNWSPTSTPYFTDSGGNSKIQVGDISGAYYTGAGYSKSASQAFTASTFTVVNFDSIDYDADGTVATGTSWRYSIIMPGQFRVHAQVQVNAAAADTVYVAVFKNNAEYKRSLIQAGAGGIVDAQIDVELKCAGGDFLDVRIFSNNASPVVQNTPQNYINIVRMFGS
jgi:hypothetical protein